MNWKPMLATNAKMDKIKFPTYGSLKLEGVRGEFTPGGLLTRPLKQFGNKLLAKRFESLLLWCKVNGATVEGEFYKHGMDFSSISSICRRANHPDTDKLDFYIFDIYLPGMESAKFKTRAEVIKTAVGEVDQPFIKRVVQIPQNNIEEVQSAYEDALDAGYEGWVMKDPEAAYKKGRSTVNEGYFIRLKPEETFEGVVIDIVERMENLCESEENELGYLSKRQDKDMKAGTGLAAVAIVESKGFKKPIRVSLSRGIQDYTDTKKSRSRAYIFANKGDFIGKYLRFVGFTISGMDLPRSPRFDEWRTDLD